MSVKTIMPLHMQERQQAAVDLSKEYRDDFLLVICPRWDERDKADVTFRLTEEETRALAERLKEMRCITKQSS